jgi:hypothetical protein
MEEQQHIFFVQQWTGWYINQEQTGRCVFIYFFIIPIVSVLAVDERVAEP